MERGLLDVPSIYGLIKILVIAPHTDDAELGAGAAISRWHSEGHEIWILNLSDTSNVSSKQAGFNLRIEAQNASSELGVPSDHILFGDFKTREFQSERQRLLDFLIVTRNQIQPDLVIGPSANDIHQDHSSVSEEIARAFSGKSSILGYDTYWNINNQACTFVVEISEEDLNTKVRALAMFESQKNRPYMDRENIKAQARVRGLPRGYEYAEAFSVVEISMSKQFTIREA